MSPTTGCARIVAADHPDKFFILATLADQKLNEIACFIAQKMALTLKDRKSHSALLGEGRLAVEILTLRESVGGAAKWFIDNHGGYVAMLDTLMPHAANSGAEAFCQITMGMKSVDDAEAWVNIAFLPLKGTAFKSMPIIPTDLAGSGLK